MTDLRGLMRELAEEAPAVPVPPDLYVNARRNRRRRRTAAVAAVLAIAALVVTGLIARPHPQAERFGGGEDGLPERLLSVPASTGANGADPVGPAAVIFSLGEDNPQSDHEDFGFAWWRGGHTVESSTIVARDRDAYRIVRAGYSTGAELSPDGRYLLSEGRVLDLATGDDRLKLRTVPPEQSWAPDGETPPYDGGVQLYGRWTEDGRRIVAVQDDRVVLVSWPSGQVERVLRTPQQRPVDQHVMVSPDARTVVVQSNNLLRGYDVGGTLSWSQEVSTDALVVAGRAAWRPDGRLFVFDRTDTVCDLCGWKPGTWRLSARDGATGERVAAPDYPAIRDAMYVNVLTWRGDVAYAVVSYTNHRTDDLVDVTGTALVRLRPGAAVPEVVLAGPEGTRYLGVATDLVERIRPLGEPDFGHNSAETLGLAVTWGTCPAIVLSVVVVALILRRRRRVR
ncbi:hypothetical protein Val02_46200 [Virgisporangium aliadipatigenens]|uniref:WD40 repeat domain-containing protein n=1 Tax=Virgisporangium aliadipatigenens TaxID=741659 RepID=A0A8J3YLN6_9ACTN|nr:hypothetical protein [Virgisporangium aliadipatigenens]GIJ47734.1 hypothetical protein Val02_46200 [Virgisporangium aliadipatigenens]